MKFTKEEAREKITQEFSKKVEKIDTWKRTIEENVETLCSLLGEESEISIEDFSAKAISLLDTQLGHLNKSNKEVALGLDAQIKKLETKLKSYQQPKKEPEPEPEPGGNHTLELEKRLQQLEQQLADEQREKQIIRKKSDLVAKIKEKGVKNEDWINAMLSKATISEETNIDDEADSYVTIYNKFHSDTPFDVTPAGSGGRTRIDDLKDTIKRAGELRKSNNGILQ